MKNLLRRPGRRFSVASLTLLFIVGTLSIIAGSNALSVANKSTKHLNAQTVGDVQPDPTKPIRGAFYYPWFGAGANSQGWQQTSADGVLYSPFTNYHPTDGYWASNDTTKVAKQVQEMQYAGIQLGIASWWGQGSFTDQNYRSLFTATNQLNSDFRWAALYETEGNGSNPSATQITADLNYLKTQYATDTSYFRINGKYVIYVYAQAGDACTGTTDMAQRWSDANAATGNQWYVVMKVFPNYATCAAQPQSFYQYGPAANVDVQGNFSYVISPGFWKKGDTGITPTGTPRLLRNVGRFRNDVIAMTQSSAQWHLITTWDEWGEGSAIEPASEYQSDSGYGQYIDILHRYKDNTGSIGGGVGHTAPSAPLNPVATVATINSANVSWTAPANIGGDPITSYVVTSTPGAHVATVTGNPPPTTATVNTLSPTAPNGYTFTVTATNTNGTSPASAPSNVVNTGSGGTALPAAPTAVTINAIGNAAVTVGWTCVADPAGAPVLDYTVTSNPGALTGTAGVPCNGSNQQQVTVNGLTNATPYTFTVKARNVNGFSANSAASASATPTAGTTTPGAPLNVVASPGNAQATVSWSAPASNGGSAITSYIVTPFLGSIAQTTSTVVGSPPPTNKVVTGLTNGSSYTFKVAAVNAVGTGAQSSASGAVTPTTGATAPSAPTGVSATGGTLQATVNWQTPTSDGGSPITGYNILASDNVTGKSVGVVNSSSITMAPGNYTFQVKACNNVGCSASSTASNSVTVQGNTTGGATCNGTAAPATWKHMLIIMMENHAWGAVGGVGFGASQMPFSHSVWQPTGTSTAGNPGLNCGVFSTFDDTNTGENSLTQYMGLTTGHNDTNWSSDCSPSGGCSYSGTTEIFNQISNTAGATVKNYVEGAGGACSSSGNAAKHIPSLYMYAAGHAGNGGAADHNKCLAQTVPLPNLLTDINNGTLPTFGMITPNLCNDMHDCGGSVGDAFLKLWVNRLINGSNYKNGDTLVMMDFDEERPTPNFFIGPSVKQGINTACHNAQYTLFQDLSRMSGNAPMPTDGRATGFSSEASSCRASMNY